MRSGITKRWLRGSLLITLLAVLLAEVLFVYTTYQSYYNATRQTIVNRFSAITGQLQITSGGSVADAASSRSLALHRMVEQFDAKDKLEFMLLDSSGRVITTSSGRTDEAFQTRGDFSQALEDNEGIGQAVYTTSEGEKVMAVTTRVPYAAEDVAALRMVTSLTLIDEIILQRAVMGLAVGAVTLLIAVWSGLFFVRSIVVPLAQVEATATRIAKGDLDARLPDVAPRDEIGRLCQTINRMAEDLSKTDQMKNEFISSVSHELRTPLTSIKGWVETIAGIRDPEDETYRRGLAIIGTETDRLYNMVEELLDFSRLQNGSIRMNCEPLDLVAEVTDAALFFEARIKQAGMVLDYREPELPMPVWADAGRLRQVFVNILDNAVKYSQPGGRIRLAVEPVGADLRVSVTDQGRGIAPEDLDQVKLKFFKGKNAVRGSGIGLAVVDEIVRALQGRLDIASTLGVGTTVTVTLPCYHAEAKAALAAVGS